MKPFVQFAMFALLLSVICGCATSEDRVEIKIRPPEKMNPVFLKYKSLPEPKVFVVAVDPGFRRTKDDVYNQAGNWAYGFDYNAESLEEAARIAAMKCDRAREKHKVQAPARLFAINNEIVYYNQD